MRFANVHGQKIGAIFVVIVNLNDVANLAAKGRSSKTSKHQHERALMRSFAEVETANAVQRDNPRVRRIAAHFQRAAMHVRQRVAHHSVNILGAPSYVGQNGESCNQQRAENSTRPFPEAIQLKFFSLSLIRINRRKESITRGHLSSATCRAPACNAPALFQ